jgi:hypothetical protein
MKRLVVAEKQFSYGGRHRDIGEVFELLGLKNDDIIWGLTEGNKIKPGRYTSPFDGNVSKLFICDECGARFVQSGRRDLHFRNRHGG